MSPLPKSYSNFVAFNFQPVVQVTKSIPKVTFMNVINDAGSSSGLWLGASVFSIFKMFQTGSFCCCFRGHAYKTVREHLTIVAAMFATMWCISLGFIFIFHYFWIFRCILVKDLRPPTLPLTIWILNKFSMYMYCISMSKIFSIFVNRHSLRVVYLWVSKLNFSSETTIALSSNPYWNLVWTSKLDISL